eukprot:7623074-Pyramimonas_sp.AAC.1
MSQLDLRVRKIPIPLSYHLPMVVLMSYHECIRFLAGGGGGTSTWNYGIDTGIDTGICTRLIRTVTV